MTIAERSVLDIPGVMEPLDIRMPSALAALRDSALALHREARPGIPEIELSDARTWETRAQNEDWLIWRARRCAGRLRALPVDLTPGTGAEGPPLRIAGKPLFRKPAPQETSALDRARAVLAAIPPFPGGDAGHFHPDYEKLFRVGIKGILKEIAARRKAPQTTAPQRVFYDACRIVMEGLSAFAANTANACRKMALKDKRHAASWRELATVCRRVAVEPPGTFHEAVQLMFLTLIALWFGEDHGLTTPGRMDQTLRRFYEADLAAGRITRQEAFELICSLYIELNRILWPGSAVSVIVGGRDADNRDATNALSYLCLAARMATKLVYPTVGVAWHEDTPGEFTDFCVRMLATGIGDPAFFNDRIISEGLREHGVTDEDSRNYMNSTCVEIKVCGTSNIWVTAPYINCPKALLEEMQRPPAPETFAALEERVRENLAQKIRAAAADRDRAWKERARTGCFPLASCLIKDCLERGQDYDRGGARYNWVENSFVGLANLVDGLLAIKRLVYDQAALSLQDLNEALQKNYAGHEPLRQRIINTLPKYGNDEAVPDQMAREWAEFLIASTESCTVGPHRYVPGFFCWVMHERLGTDTGATPDGRLAGWPLADGAGAAQGRERRGPTASVLSTTKWCHRKVLGGLVHNVKFPKSLLKSEEARKALRGLIETYMRRGGFEIQVNAVGKETLLEAQKHPEQYRDLLVRVAGYSDYFVHLNAKMQEEVIARTEHTL